MPLVIRTTGVDEYLDAAGEAHIKALVLGEPSAGKGHPLTTPILTPTGWVDLGKLQVGDHVVGSDGLPHTITAVHERGILPIRRVTFIDGTSIDVDPEHLWKVREHHGWRVLETQQLGDLTRTVATNEVPRWEIPLVAPIQHPWVQVPLDPYVLGALLANGHFSDHVQLTVSFGQEWESHVDEIRLRVPGWMNFVEVTRTTNATARQFHLHQCLPILRDLGLSQLRSGKKFIPEIYLRADEEQRRALLAGLMDTDGGMRGRTPWYYSTSLRLAQDVADLVRGLGGIATVHTVPRDDKPTEHNVKVLLDRIPFRAGPKPGRWAGPSERLFRRIQSVEDAGYAEVRCITVDSPDHLYVAANHTVTHNTRSASYWPGTIYADCERGRMSLADRKVPFAAIDSSAKMDALLRMLEVECAMRSAAERKYKTLVVDTIDSFQRTVVQEILKATKKEALNGYQDWGLLDAKMTAFISRLHKLPMNVIVNCHVQTTQDGDNGPLIWEPKLQGGVRKQIPADFDLVGFMTTHWEAVNGQRTLCRSIEWHPRPNFPILKDRSGQLPQFTDVTFSDADYNTIFETMFMGDHFNELEAGETIQELATEDEVEVVAPHAGGPVAKKAAAKTAAPQKAPGATPTAEPAARKATVPPARKAGARAAAAPVQAQRINPVPEPAPAADSPAAAPEAPVEKPVEKTELSPTFQEGQPEMAIVSDPDEQDPLAEEQTMEAAQAVVEEALGGTVVSEEPPADEAPMTPPAATPPAAAPPAAVTTAPSTTVIACGQARKNSTTEPAPGCGKDLANLSQPERDLVNISLIKTRTYLCPDCLGKWRAANS